MFQRDHHHLMKHQLIKVNWSSRMKYIKLNSNSVFYFLLSMFCAEEAEQKQKQKPFCYIKQKEVQHFGEYITRYTYWKGGDRVAECKRDHIGSKCRISSLPKLGDSSPHYTPGATTLSRKGDFKLTSPIWWRALKYKVSIGRRQKGSFIRAQSFPVVN